VPIAINSKKIQLYRREFKWSDDNW